MNVKIVLVSQLPSKTSSEVHALEIKRFPVPNFLNYASLAETTESHLPLLKGKTYSIYWADEFGDYISVTSDTEMQHALELMRAQSSLVRFFVVCPVSDGGVVHPHVACDSCDMSPIVGDRFKCTSCPDFDLCRNCESRGAHNQHIMVRYHRPIINTGDLLGVFSPRSYKPKCRNVSFSESSDTDDVQLCKSGKRCASMQTCSKVRRHHGSHRDRKRDENEYHGCRKDRKRDNGEYRGCGVSSGDEWKKLHSRAHKKGDAKHKAQACLNMGVDFMAGLAQVASTLAGAALNNMGEKNSENPQTAGVPSASAAASSSASSSEPMATASSPPPTGNVTATATAFGAESVAATGPSTAIPIPLGTTHSGPSTAIPIPLGTTYPLLPSTPTAPRVNFMDTAIKGLSEILSQQSLEPNVPDWTMVNADGAVASASGQNRPQPKEGTKLQRAVEILESMGFNNETGILSRVLEANGGDLGKALDILIPKKM